MRIGVNLGPVSVYGGGRSRSATEDDGIAGGVVLVVLVLLVVAVTWVFPWFQANWYWIRWVLMISASLILGFFGNLITTVLCDVASQLRCGCLLHPERFTEPVERASDRVSGNRLLVPGPPQYRTTPPQT